jgi:hypothetical protein
MDANSQFLGGKVSSRFIFFCETNNVLSFMQSTRCFPFYLFLLALAATRISQPSCLAQLPLFVPCSTKQVQQQQQQKQASFLSTPQNENSTLSLFLFGNSSTHTKKNQVFHFQCL